MPVYHFTVHAYRSCKRRKWRLHGVGTEPLHFHWVVSWKGFVPWQEVRRVTKNVLGLLLNRITGQKGRRWFVRDGSRKRVTDPDHLNHLLNKYLPDHRVTFWREGMPLPSDRFAILES